MADILLNVEGMKVYYPVKGDFGKGREFVKAVDGVSFEVRKGEVFGIVGESGCGKSTLGRGICKLETPTAGKIVLSGEDISSYGRKQMRSVRKKVQMVFPELIIADEPVSALDVSIQAQVLNLLHQLQKEFNLTYIFVAHDLSVVEHISDRVGVMYLGNFVEVGDKRKLYSNPLHPYTQALLSAVPVPDPTAKKERIILEGSIPSALNPPSGCKFHTRCPKCMDICKEKVPERYQVSDDHYVYCHLYDDKIKENKE